MVVILIPPCSKVSATGREKTLFLAFFCNAFLKQSNRILNGLCNTRSRTISSAHKTMFTYSAKTCKITKLGDTMYNLLEL